MVFLNNDKFKKGLLTLAVSAAISGCGSSSSSSSTDGTTTPSTTETTTFPVTVDVPESLVPTVAASFDWSNPLKSLISSAYAQTVADLGKENFEVVVVDGDGNVVQVVPADQIQVTEIGNGEYEISVPGEPQLNCLIVLDLDNSLTITANETNINDTNALFAPTTSEEGVDIDLESTVAYQQFLEDVAEDAFEDGTYDVTDRAQVAAIEQLVNNVEQELERVDLETIIANNGLTIEQFLAADDEGVSDQTIIDALAAIEEDFETEVNNIIQEQVDDIANATSTTIASLFEEGGLNWFEADVFVSSSSPNNEPYSKEFYDLDADWGSIASSGTETFYEYDFDNNEWGEGETFDPNTDSADDDLVLTANGWSNTSDSFEFVSSDTVTGTVMIRDVLINNVQYQVNTLQALDLEGKNVEDFMATNADEEEFSTFIDSDATFGAGATAVKVNFTEVNDNYYLWYDASGEVGCGFEVDVSGNCEVVMDYNGNTPLTQLSQMVTDTPSTEENITESETAFRFSNVLLELVETSSDTSTTRTVNVFEYVQNDSDLDIALERFEASDQSVITWTYETPTGLPDGEQIIKFTFPSGLKETLDIDDNELTHIYAVVDGYVRQGSFVAAGQTEDSSGEWVFNSTAADNIENAFDGIYQDAFLVDCGYESGWDDDAFNGFGAPIEPNTLKAFTASVNAEGCGGIDSSATSAVITANTWYEGGDAFTFNADGTGSVSFQEDGEDVTFALTWTINTAADDNIPNGTVVAVINGEQDGVSFTFTEHYAPVGYDSETNVISLKIFSTNSVWYGEGSDIPEGTGEIWTAAFTDSNTETTTEDDSTGEVAQ